jgi:hypothetical protein
MGISVWDSFGVTRLEKAPNPKHQITNKLQFQNSKLRIKELSGLGYLDIGN